MVEREPVPDEAVELTLLLLSIDRIVRMEPVGERERAKEGVREGVVGGLLTASLENN